MSTSDLRALIEGAEARNRTDTGIVWDFQRSHSSGTPDNRERKHPSEPCFRGSSTLGRRGLGSSLPAEPESGAWNIEPVSRTDGAVYCYDGSLEGMLSAIHHAISAHDTTADIQTSAQVQPRLDQPVIEVETNLQKAMIVRRSLDYAQGLRAFDCVRAAAASDDPTTATVIYRFVQYALASSNRTGCNSCARKRTCTRACTVPPTTPLLDDVSTPAVFAFILLYREVMNERHLMEQFIRFEHCEGDVWFARCNPKASVVPLLMDWFVPRFNDQSFIIYDENHALSGVYDGRQWYLVASDTIAPPRAAADEQLMQEAWRAFYRSVSIDARYHPELRRNFMPMRLWRNLPELRQATGEAPLRDSIPE